jgi:hypothetical protein
MKFVFFNFEYKVSIKIWYSLHLPQEGMHFDMKMVD